MSRLSKCVLDYVACDRTPVHCPRCFPRSYSVRMTEAHEGSVRDVPLLHRCVLCGLLLGFKRQTNSRDYRVVHKP